MLLAPDHCELSLPALVWGCLKFHHYDSFPGFSRHLVTCQVKRLKFFPDNTNIQHFKVGMRWEVTLSTANKKVLSEVVKFLAGTLGKVEETGMQLHSEVYRRLFGWEFYPKSLRATLARVLAALGVASGTVPE